MWIEVSFFQYILQGCFPALLSSLFLIAFIILDRTFSYKVLILFIHAMLFAIILCVAQCIELHLIQTNQNLPLRKILAAISYSCRICTIGFTVAISQRTSSKTCAFVYIFMFLNTLISFVSIPTGIVFSFNQDGSWNAGPLFVFPYLCCLYYIALLLISSFKKFFSNFGEAIIIIGIFFLCIAANLLELFCDYTLLLANAYLIGIEFYFLCLNVQLYRRDSLTNLLNRRSFYMDAKRHSSNHLIVLSMDLNDLKIYNDLEGHSAGDLALITVSEYMITSFRKYGKVYRTGGDEFMALFVDKNSTDIKSYVDVFNKRLSKTRYTVACGFADFFPGENFDRAVELADEKMYENKRILKGCEAR